MISKFDWLVLVSPSFNIDSLWPSDAMWQQEIVVNICSSNGLLPDGTKPLPEPMLAYHQLGQVTFIWGNFTRDISAVN